MRDQSPSQSSLALDRNSPLDHNPSVEGLRGLLASLVLGTHLYRMAGKVHLIAIPAAVDGLLHPYKTCIFFAISGFFTLHTLLRNGNLKQFAWRRFARIYPLFLTLQLLLFAAGPFANYEWMGSLAHHPAEFVKAFVCNALLLPGVFNLPIAQKNTWTLSYEAAFYLISGLALLAGSRLIGLRRKVALAALIVPSSLFLYYRPCSSFFLIGLSGYWLFRIKKIELWSRYLGGPIGMLSFVFAWALFPFSILASCVATVPFFYAVLYQTGWHSRLLSTRLPTSLGRISFSLYLLHPFVLGAARAVSLHLVKYVGPSASFFVFVAVGLAGSVIVAKISYEIVEKRLTCFLGGKCMPRSSEPVPALVKRGATSREATNPEVLSLEPLSLAELPAGVLTGISTTP